MKSFRDRLKHNVLELSWSLWAELGVAGWSRRHEDVCIDPEPLFLFTARIGEFDARLLDESIDWAIRFGRFVSKVRLKNLLNRSDTRTRQRFNEYAATVNHFAHLAWPANGAQPRRKFQPSGRSHLEDFRRPALLALRTRALFGVSARAEIVRVLVGDPRVRLTATEFAYHAHYGKRNVADALEALRLANVLSRLPFGNADRYGLLEAEGLTRLLRPIPEKTPTWSSLFELLSDLLDLAERIEELPALSRAVEAQRFAERRAVEISRLGLPQPPKIGPGLEVWALFERWAVRLTEGMAANEDGAFGREHGRAAVPVSGRTARVRSR
jgi:hypothetical protein